MNDAGGVDLSPQSYTGSYTFEVDLASAREHAGSGQMGPSVLGRRRSPKGPKRGDGPGVHDARPRTPGVQNYSG